jgi:hypothetical protein
MPPGHNHGRRGPDLPQGGGQDSATSGVSESVSRLSAGAICSGLSNSPGLPAGSRGLVGGSCTESSPPGISGGSHRTGRRNTMVLIGGPTSFRWCLRFHRGRRRSRMTWLIRVRHREVVIRRPGAAAATEEQAPVWPYGKHERELIRAVGHRRRRLRERESVGHERRCRKWNSIISSTG